MTKETFDKTREMLKSIFLDDFANLFVQYELTSYDVNEVLDDLAYRGFCDKYDLSSRGFCDKYNQLTEGEEEIDEDGMDKRLKKFILNLYKTHNFEYDETKDIYANYGSQLFGIPYEECLEFKDGKPYPIGKSRRRIIKLAICLQFM